MFRLSIIACLVVASWATPATRTSEQITSYRDFLQTTTKVSDVPLSKRMEKFPKAHPWENSGKFQGDMLLDDRQIEALTGYYATGNRNAYTFPDSKWPNNIIPYEFANGYFTNSEKNVILDAMREIEQKTCIRFVERSNQVQYVLISGESDGCYAHVGYWDWRQEHTLNVAPIGCLGRTTIIHEWLHIIGFVHMHEASNRDDYVVIMWQNIYPGMEHNFHMYPANITDHLDLPYEYASCMHYGPYSFSGNSQPTIVALYDFEGVMGRQEDVTDLDWLRANRHYNCPGAWSKTAKTKIEEARH